MLIKLVLGILAAYLGICVLLYLFQDQFIFFPTSLSAFDREQLRKRYPNTEIQMTTPDGVSLYGWLHKVPAYQDKPLIIYFGGNAEGVWLNLPDLDKFGDTSMLLMNYRAYGGSGGKPSEKHLFADALFVFDEMVEKYGFDPKKIILMGRSLGSGVAVHLAGERKVRALILITPFDSLASVGQKAYPIFPVKQLLKHRFDSVSLAPRIKAPLLAIAAQEDSIIPLSASENLVANWNGPAELVIVPGRDHNDIHLSKIYWQTIQEFMAQIR